MPSFVAVMPMYIIKAFVQDWLTALQMTLLDSAMCNYKDRTMLLQNISNAVIAISVSERKVVLCFDWCRSRDIGVRSLVIVDAAYGEPALPSIECLPILKLRSFEYSVRSWSLVNLIFSQVHPQLEEFTLSSMLLSQKEICTTKIPKSCRRISLLGNCFASIKPVDLTTLFSKVEDVQSLYIKAAHCSREFNSRLSLLLDRVGHSLTKLSLVHGHHPVLQKDIDLVASECPKLVSLQLNVDCDEINVTSLTGLTSLTHLRLRRIVIWEVDLGAVFRSVTHFSVPYDRLQAPKLRHFPALTHLTLTGNTAPKAARLMLWLREYDQIRVMDVRECVFLDRDKEKLLQESEELVCDRGAGSELRWIFDD